MTSQMTLANSYFSVIQNYISEIHQITSLLKSSNSLASIAHPFSDGDALGSQIALYKWAVLNNKKCYTLNFDPIPQQILWLANGIDFLTDIPQVDIIFLMEPTDISRLGPHRAKIIENAKYKIHLDHHPDIKKLGNINIIDVNFSSTCEIMYYILKSVSKTLPIDILEPLYVGIMTDTGNFKYSNTKPDTFIVASEMLKAGLDMPKIYKKVYENNSIKRILIHGIAMSRVQSLCNGQIVYSFLCLNDFIQNNIQETEAEGSVNHLCTISDHKLAILFRELMDNRMKISFRSPGEINVQKIAKLFGGGGHTVASSAIVAIEKDLQYTINKVLEICKSCLNSKEFFCNNLNAGLS